MEYYHQLITEKSFQILQNLRQKHKFILIGGWAVFLFTHSLKSKDIDVIIDYEELSKLKEDCQVFKNDRLKKYEIKREGIDIDIYLPHYSELGLPIEEIQKNTLSREGFNVPKLEILLILKQGAYEQRQGSSKGEKDKIDIFSILNLSEIDWTAYQEFLIKHDLFYQQQNLKNLLRQTTEIKELNLNQAKMAKLKKIILEKLKNLQNSV